MLSGHLYCEEDGNMSAEHYTGAEKTVTNEERFKMWVRAPLCDPNVNYYGSGSTLFQREILL